MPDFPAEVSLLANDVAPVRGPATLTIFTQAERVRRAAAVFGIAILAAAALLPIPIIHLFGPPLVLITGGVTAVRQLRAEGRLSVTRLACPKCGGDNRVGGGLGVRAVEAPSERLCEVCRRVLTLQVRRLDEPSGSPPLG